MQKRKSTIKPLVRKGFLRIRLEESKKAFSLQVVFFITLFLRWLKIILGFPPSAQGLPNTQLFQATRASDNP